MSADLFAEFSKPSGSPNFSRSQGQQDSQPQQTGTSPGPSNFAFGTSSTTATASFQSWTSPQANASSLNDWDQRQRQQAVPSAPVEDEDTWGDFEVAESENTHVSQQATPLATNVTDSNVSWGSFGDFGSNEIQIQPSMAPDPIQSTSSGQDNAARRLQPTSQPASLGKPNQSSMQRGHDTNVLFDADDFELQGEDGGLEGDDFDEFGDFEATSTAEKTRESPARPTVDNISASMDLLGLDDQITTTSTPGPPVAATASSSSVTGSTSGALKFGALSSNQLTLASKPGVAKSRTANHAVTSRSTVTASTFNDNEIEDGWSSWDDPTHSRVQPASAQGTASPTTNDWGWDDRDESGPAAAENQNDNAPPPINVPPPSILLSSFPDLFNTGNALLKPVAGQSISLKNQVLTDPKAIQFLQGFVLLGTTAARVMAGRKHRWHRDKILAKSMSISAAGSKGMKLAGVDKTQSAREEREAADVTVAWREHIGRLRSAVAVANSTGKLNIKVPELSETMLVQTAKMVPTAPKPCIICGLKREERIAKVDFDVEDSFGEWWVEHWGHRACKNFWIEHEEKLRQR